MRHSSRFLCILSLFFIGFSALIAPGQSAALRPDTASGTALIPDAPLPFAQSAEMSPPSSSDIGLRSSGSLQFPGVAQDRQQNNPSQPSPSDDSLQKPVRQNSLPARSPQTKRILGIVPNFRSVSTDEKLPPMTAKEKFLTATDDSFDYSSIFIPGALAGISMARDSTPEFGQGAAGYGQYLWHSALDQTSENYMVEFVFPVVTHQDNRYYTLGRGGFFKRTGYALSRAVITRNDAGNETFNTSEVVGSGASAGLSNLYYPASQRGFSNTASEWAVDIGIDAGSFVVKEFWPDINRKIFHQSDPIEGAAH